MVSSIVMSSVKYIVVILVWNNFYLYTYELEDIFHHNYNRVHVFGCLPFLLEINFVLSRDEYGWCLGNLHVKDKCGK